MSATEATFSFNPDTGTTKTDIKMRNYVHPHGDRRIMEKSVMGAMVCAHKITGGYGMTVSMATVQSFATWALADAEHESWLDLEQSSLGTLTVNRYGEEDVFENAYLAEVGDPIYKSDTGRISLPLTFRIVGAPQ